MKRYYTVRNHLTNELHYIKLKKSSSGKKDCDKCIFERVCILNIRRYKPFYAICEYFNDVYWEQIDIREMKLNNLIK